MVMSVNRIGELRKEYEMKQFVLAELLKVSQQTVSRYEKGERDLGTDDIRRLCEIFHVSADYLLGFSSRRTPEISPEDAELLSAYHAAPEEIRDIVDGALARYKGEKITAAG